MKALRSKFCIRSQLLLGVMMAALAKPALADTNLTTSVSNPITTAQDGNITINSGLSVTSTASGAAGATITINSNASVLDDAGSIVNTAATDGIGVHLIAGNTGLLTIDSSGTSTIDVTGNQSFGVLLDGNGSFTGDIQLQPASIMILTGNRSTAVDIAAPLIGNVNYSSTSTIYGNGSIGLLTTAPINGLLTVGGSLDLYGDVPTLYSADHLDPLTGSAVMVGADVTGGIQISPSSLVQNRSNLPVFLVAPSVTGQSSGSVTLAPLDSGNQSVNVSFMNFGTIQVTEGDETDSTSNPGITTTGVRLGETDPSKTGKTVLPGGFINSGVISASSRSDTFLAPDSASLIGPTGATALEIGNGTTILAFSRTAPVGTGSTTSTIVLDPGASPYDSEYNGFTVTYDFGGTIGNLTTTVTCYLAGNQTAIINPDPSSTCVPLADTLANGESWPSTPVGGNYTLTAAAPLINAGSIAASTTGAKGGTVYGIHILAGGNVSGLENLGLIQAVAATTDTSIANLSAYGIKDDSGTLTTVNNFGTITAAASTLNGNTQQQIAIDLSHGTAIETVVVSAKTGASSIGTVNGDILFGSAPAALTDSRFVSGVQVIIPGNHLFIDGSTTDSSGNVTAVASVTGSIHSAPGGTLDIEVSNDIPGSVQFDSLGNPVLTTTIADDFGGQLKTDNTQANQLIVNTKGKVEVALDKFATPSAPRIDIEDAVTPLGIGYGTGVAAFRNGSQIVIAPTTFLPLSSTSLTTYDLIHAQTLLDIENPAAYNTNAIPFLLVGNITQTNNDLLLTARLKTTSELGLTGNSAAIYGPLTKAALNNDAYGSALLALPDAASVRSAVASTLPDMGGGIRALAISMTDQATGVIGSRQRGLVTADPETGNGFHFWGQEFYNNVSDNGGSQFSGYGGAGQGMALGAEWGSLARGRYGISYNFFSSEETERHPVDDKTDGDWNLISAYAGWRADNFFVSPEISAGEGTMLSRRGIAAGNISTAAFTATANWTGYIVAGGVSTGYVVNLGDFQIIPEIALDAMYLHNSAYNETGATGLNLSIAPQNQESLRAFAGVIGQTSFRLSDARVMPKFLAGWSHEFDADPATIDGSFESTPGSAFHLVGPTVDTDHAVGGASFTYVMRNWQAGVNVDAQVGARTTEEAATVNLSSRF